MFSTFAHIPGLKVVLPTTAIDAKGLLISAIRDDNPVIFIEHRWLYYQEQEVPEEAYTIPIGEANILRKGAVPATFLPAVVTLGSGSASFELLRYLEERLPVMTTPRWIQTPCQPIAIRNVVNYLQGSLEYDETTGQTYDIGGPDRFAPRRGNVCAVDPRRWPNKS